MIGFADLQTIRKTGVCPLCGSSVDARGAGSHVRSAYHQAFVRAEELRARGWISFPQSLTGGYNGSDFIALMKIACIPHEEVAVPARDRSPATWSLFAPRAVVRLLHNQPSPVPNIVLIALKRASQLSPTKQEQFFAAADAAVKLGASPLDMFEALT